MKPSIGRIVHFVPPHAGTPGGHYAAMIIDVHTDTEVTVVHWDKHGTQATAHCTYDESAGKPFTWHWPELIEANV